MPYAVVRCSAWFGFVFRAGLACAYVLQCAVTLDNRCRSALHQGRNPKQLVPTLLPSSNSAVDLPQVPVVMAAALLPGTFYVKLNRNMIAAAIAAVDCPEAAAAASFKPPTASSPSMIPAASFPASPGSASHQGSAAAAAGAATGATCRPVDPSARAAGQSMAAAVAGARTAGQVVGDVGWQQSLGSWVVSASLEAADGRPHGVGSTGRGHGGRATTAGGSGLGSGVDAEAEAETDDSREWAEVKGGCDLNMVIVEDAVVDARWVHGAWWVHGGLVGAGQVDPY